MLIEHNHCFRIGLITKLHGKDGAVVLQLEDASPEEIQKTGYVIVEIDGGLVPFFFSEANASELNTTALCIKFDEIAGQEEAKELPECPVFLKKEKNEDITIGEHTFSEDDISQYRIVEKKYGDLGYIESIEKYPEELFVLTYQDKEILIPVVEEFIEEIDDAERIIYLNTPDGLIDLYL